MRQKELSRHRYLQTLIKKMAEGRGYKASIEEPVQDGDGRVDVLLTKDEKQIACEIGMTTSKMWELHNVKKCLAAGYDMVIAVPIDKKAAELMQTAVEQGLDNELRHKVFIMEVDELFSYLNTETVKELPNQKRVKGYRIKVEHTLQSFQDAKTKKKSLAQVLFKPPKKQ